MTARRKKPATGHAAMGHARTLVAAMWPGCPTHEATKAVRWIVRGGMRPQQRKALLNRVRAAAAAGASDSAITKLCEQISGPDRIPMSVREDLFGVFDLLVLRPGRLEAIQVTTWAPGDGAGVERRRKIRLWAEKYFGQVAPDPGIYRVSVWSWESPKQFRVWELDWSTRQWERRPHLVKQAVVKHQQQEAFAWAAA